MSTAAKLVRTNGADEGTTELPRYAQKHFSVREIAELWGLSDDSVRHLFEREPGVLVIGDQRPSIRKRRYSTLRIPEDVVERVHRRLSKV